MSTVELRKLGGRGCAQGKACQEVVKNVNNWRTMFSGAKSVRKMWGRGSSKSNFFLRKTAPFLWIIDKTISTLQRRKSSTARVIRS